MLTSFATLTAFYIDWVLPGKMIFLNWSDFFLWKKCLFMVLLFNFNFCTRISIRLKFFEKVSSVVFLALDILWYTARAEIWWLFWHWQQNIYNTQNFILQRVQEPFTVSSCMFQFSSESIEFSPPSL
jgi:hypothetical protein